MSKDLRADPRLVELLEVVDQRARTLGKQHTIENRDRVVEAKLETRKYVDEEVDFYRNKLRHLAALCAMASSKLCQPVSEKDIVSAKECVEVGIEVMRDLVAEDKLDAHRRALQIAAESTEKEA